MVSSYRLLEKNELFEAVSGVVGVLGICLDGGGLKSRLGRSWLCCDEPFPTLGIFNGPRLIGGSVRGCRLFLPDGVLGFSSFVLVTGTKELFLALGLRCTLIGSGRTGIVMLPVELACAFIVSCPFKPDFFLSRNKVSAGEPLGDSYAFGIAGTGGTSSSSSAGVGLCIVVCFGAGSRDVDDD
jgi:hypothetical protein